MFCGWDWGSTIHGVCLLDDDGVTIKTWMVKHTDTELAALFAELAQLGDPALIPVAIERGEGLVVGLIARAGHPVLMVEPAAFKASRARWGAAGAKSDAADAFMLADYARTDGHRLRRVEPLAQATRELAALVRARTSLVEARTAASNQLWAILAEHWPGAALVFAKLTSQIALAFLADYPTPRSAARLGEGRMHQFCRRHSWLSAALLSPQGRQPGTAPRHWCSRRRRGSRCSVQRPPAWRSSRRTSRGTLGSRTHVRREPGHPRRQRCAQPPRFSERRPTARPAARGRPPTRPPPRRRAAATAIAAGPGADHAARKRLAYRLSSRTALAVPGHQYPPPPTGHHVLDAPPRPTVDAGPTTPTFPGYVWPFPQWMS